MSLNDVINSINGVLFSNWTVGALLVTGFVFTAWSFIGQYRALTHGVQVVRGKYDDKNDPGAINHFQALSAALSATVGLGNIGGVAVAVALGGPGAIFWMWVIGLLGMAIKMTEVTQSMLYRNTDDPENPHGGPMFVVKKGFAEWGLAPIGAIFGGVFVITLIISAITGGNMFQAWNVADITKTYFNVPQVVTGIILTVLVALVIIGGIKRIGAVAGRIVPFMCVIYVLAAGYVLVVNIDQIPAMLGLIVKSGLPSFLGGEDAAPAGAFLGGTFGYAALWGIKRALFSSEAGQGSSPIAHSAAKTDEPVREGVVAGLEPFIDTIVVCTLTALVILSSGAYNRNSEAEFAMTQDVVVAFASEEAGALAAAPATAGAFSAGTGIALPTSPLPDRVPTEAEQNEAEESGEPARGWRGGDRVFVYATLGTGERVPVPGRAVETGSGFVVEFDSVASAPGVADLLPSSTVIAGVETTLYHGATPAWTLETPDLPPMTADARRVRGTEEGRAGWRDDETIFMIVTADQDSNTGRDLRRITGLVKAVESDDPDAQRRWTVNWNTLESSLRPRFRTHEDGTRDTGLYGDYAGASMTAYAFDRVTPGLGKWLVSIAAWLFALSTMISWSYYGEQGIYYFFGTKSDSAAKPAVFVYKIVYSLLILVTTVLAMPIFGPEGSKRAIIGTDAELDMWTTLGLGVMLVANIPIMWLFGHKAMKAYHEYFKRMKSGGDAPHDAPPVTEVVEGKDIE